MPACTRWTALVAMVTVVVAVEGWIDPHVFHIHCDCRRCGRNSSIGWDDAYDGETIVHYDTATKRFVAKQSFAQAVVDGRNSNEGFVNSVPQQIDSLCDKIKHTALLLNITVKAMAPTSINTFVRTEGGQDYLVCLATNFFPREIDLSWVRDGRGAVQGAARTRVVPQRDGTFQAWSVLPLAGGVHRSTSCQVEHVAINGKLVVQFDRNRNAENETLITIGAVLGILGLSAAVVTTIVYHCAINRCKRSKIQSTAKFTRRTGPCGSNPCQASVRSSESNSSNSSGSSAEGLTKSTA
uniref:rano class II histocompatibility antigen, A beta chain-like n=1 Tax=Pristiophorus japonicus TaxID=55135 RepID=UPI00398F0060